MATRLLIVIGALILGILAIPVLAIMFFVPVSSAGDQPAPVVTDSTQAAEAVRRALAGDLGLQPNQLEVVEQTSHEWTDSCLGLGGPAESCLQVITPGYRITFRAPGGDHYIVRTNLDGSVYRVEGEGQHLQPGADEITEMFRYVLAQRINDPSIEYVSHEEREWPNGCLGLAGDEEACTEAIVPGYRIVYRTADGEYVLRTDLEGSRYRLESSPVNFPAAPDFAWRGRSEAEPGCFNIAIFANGAGVIAGCGQAPTKFQLEGHDLAHLERLLRYRTIEDRYEDGSALTVRGSGEHEPGGYEIRAAGEWAELVAQASYAGRRGASWGFATGWLDDSGDPCAHVQVERYGVAFTSRCTPETNLDDVVLTDEQLDQLYVWLDSYAPFDHAGDGKSFFIFNGTGSDEASEETRDEIRAWVEALHPDR